jgi:hypothetical protein
MSRADDVPIPQRKAEPSGKQRAIASPPRRYPVKTIFHELSSGGGGFSRQESWQTHFDRFRL